MKKFVQAMKDAVLYVWQLPQNLLGLVLLLVYAPEVIRPYRDAAVAKSGRMRGGVSLGRYIILRFDTDVNVAHEYGHVRQSRLLGPLYLPVVGLWSAVRLGLHLYRPGEYFDAFPEDWADRLGGVTRDADGNRTYVPEP